VLRFPTEARAPASSPTSRAGAPQPTRLNPNTRRIGETDGEWPGYTELLPKLGLRVSQNSSTPASGRLATPTRCHSCMSPASSTSRNSSKLSLTYPLRRPYRRWSWSTSWPDPGGAAEFIRKMPANELLFAAAGEGFEPSLTDPELLLACSGPSYSVRKLCSLAGVLLNPQRQFVRRVPSRTGPVAVNVRDVHSGNCQRYRQNRF